MSLILQATYKIVAQNHINLKCKQKKWNEKLNCGFYILVHKSIL